MFGRDVDVLVMVEQVFYSRRIDFQYILIDVEVVLGDGVALIDGPVAVYDELESVASDGQGDPGDEFVGGRREFSHEL